VALGAGYHDEAGDGAHCEVIAACTRDRQGNRRLIQDDQLVLIGLGRLICRMWTRSTCARAAHDPVMRQSRRLDDAIGRLPIISRCWLWVDHCHPLGARPRDVAGAPNSVDGLAALRTKNRTIPTRNRRHRVNHITLGFAFVASGDSPLT
jgi:hypothetical protein